LLANVVENLDPDQNYYKAEVLKIFGRMHDYRNKTKSKSIPVRFSKSTFVFFAKYAVKFGVEGLIHVVGSHFLFSRLIQFKKAFLQ
jgi:predicted fused transcriptional regulator/phosphomethylpyrimidine kinase